jgi:hypothetical protein
MNKLAISKQQLELVNSEQQGIYLDRLLSLALGRHYVIYSPIPNRNLLAANRLEGAL